ncbi:MAG TPA: hypothetical protein VGB92_01045 [Longimicrobium sp.]|jgi:hypothetical protein
MNRPSLIRIRSAAATALVAVGLAAGARPASATLPNFRMCFGDVINVPGPTSMQPPTINGIILNDFGWTRAARFVFQNGTPMVDGAMQGIKDASNLYLSFELRDDPTFDNADAIVLGFDPGGASTNRRMIRIFPVNNGDMPGTNQPVRSVEILSWNGASWSNPVVDPAWLKDNMKVERISTMAGKTWNVEMKIPLGPGANQLNLPAAGDFGFFFTMVAVSGNAVVAEHHWPTDPGSVLDIFANPPDVSQWGSGTRSGATCNGVSFDALDIFTNHLVTSKITLNAPNRFFVRLNNSSINGAGTPVAANNVSATFRIANFGLPGPWANIPTAGGNPVTGNLPAGATVTLQTGLWSLSGAQQTDYANHPHQCILVELDSPDPNTMFLNRSAWRNFDFGWASLFQRTAEVATAGYPRPRRGTNQRFRLRVVRAERTIDPQAARWDTTFPPPESRQEVQREGKHLSELTQVVKGCRLTGEFIELAKNRYERCQSVGAFGFGVRHWGNTPARWTFAMRGEGLAQPQRDGAYLLTVPHGKAATLNVSIEAQDNTTPTNPTNPGPTPNPGGGRGCPVSAGMAMAGMALLGLGRRTRRRE